MTHEAHGPLLRERERRRVGGGHGIVGGRAFGDDLDDVGQAVSRANGLHSLAIGTAFDQRTQPFMPPDDVV